MKILPFAVLLPALLSPRPIGAAPAASLLVLHTNDLHDRLRPGVGGMGGVGFVAGYVRQRVAERPDSVVLDAGDVMEKGDMVAEVTRSEATYEALRRVGYHAGVPGNHEYAYGLTQLMTNQRIGGFPLLAVGVFDPTTGKPLFEPSRIFHIGDVRVAVVGVTNSSLRDSLARFLSGRPLRDAVAAEVVRIQKQSDVVIVVAHQGPDVCRELSLAAPDADVFVSGHNHQRIEEPIVVAETGALIVQTGYYARAVGELDLVVDKDRKRVASYKGRLVEMNHGTVVPDPMVAARTFELEKQLCPEAAEVVERRERPLIGLPLAQLLAQAMRQRTEAPIAMCSPVWLRDHLPAGDVDINALNRVYVPSHARRRIVMTQLSGAEIVRWVEQGTSRGEPIAWDGFEARTESVGNARRVVSTTLEPDRRYRVALTGGDVELAVRRQIVFSKPPELEPVDSTVIQAFIHFMRARKAVPAVR